jgi:PAS domain S-box-containing protein
MTQTSKNISNNFSSAAHNILESISDGVFTVDRDWKITYFNSAAEKIVGITREKAIGSICSEVFKSNMCQEACALRQTFKTKKPVINKAGFIISATGDRVPITLSTAVLKDSQGDIIGGAETFRDLSELEELKSQLTGRFRLGEFVSNSPAMQPIFDILPAVSATTSNILIQGETGTGKEVLARTIHSMGPRAKNPFIAVNCAALPDTLLESELFGYKKGAFTGAKVDKPGRFAMANKGTLFLDEIGEITPSLQVKLLRVLQDQTYDPLGSVKSEKTDARIITATNLNLSEMVKKGEFRQDLFYRINVLTLELPPLRSRKEDILFLSEHFIELFNKRLNRKIDSIAPNVYCLLIAHHWPGNIRELENVIERAFVLCNDSMIGIEHLPPYIRGENTRGIEYIDIKLSRKLAEKQSIVTALKRNKYNRTLTARELGIHKTTLYRKIKMLDISLPEIDGRYSRPE